MDTVVRCLLLFTASNAANNANAAKLQLRQTLMV